MREDDAGLWRVRNISDSGMMMLTDADVRSGERLSIHLSDTIVVEATVVWSADGACGVLFDEPVACTAVLRYLAAERRDRSYRPLRLAAGLHALVHGETGISAAKVTDISQKGVRLEGDCRLQPGMQIRLVLENGVERHGIVRWARGGQTGVVLDDPFTPQELESLRSLQGGAERRRSRK